LNVFLELSLSRREKQVLAKLKEIEGLTISAAARFLAKEMPESTAKYTLRGLEKKGVIIRNSPLHITPFGKFLLGVLEK